MKKSNRFSVDNMCWRKYCSRQVIQGADSEIYNQQEKTLDQIYGFILCEKIGLKIDTFTQKCIDEIKSRPTHLLPNIIVSLNDGILIYLDSKNNCIRHDIHYADSLYFINNPNGNFQYLLSCLNLFISAGRSTHILPFNKYILKEDNLPGNGIRISI